MWLRKKKPVVSLPGTWTLDLWQKLINVRNEFHCFLGIDRYGVKTDFIYNKHQPCPTRTFGGFIGGPETSATRLLRASLNFNTRSQHHPDVKLPAESQGIGYTNQWDHRPPSLCFTVFATPEVESTFEDLFVRAKLIGISHLAVNIWAEVLEDWPTDDSGRFSRVLNITRLIFRQNISLHGPISQEESWAGDF